MSVDILGTNCDQCRSMVQCCFTSTETVRLITTGSPGRQPTSTQLLNSEGALFIFVHRRCQHPAKGLDTNKESSFEPFMVWILFQNASSHSCFRLIDFETRTQIKRNKQTTTTTNKIKKINKKSICYLDNSSEQHDDQGTAAKKVRSKHDDVSETVSSRLRHNNIQYSLPPSPHAEETVMTSARTHADRLLVRLV